MPSDDPAPGPSARRGDAPSAGSPPGADARGGAALDGALLFVISMATITLQIVQVRIFSYTMNHAFVYMAISLAMVGFGLSGTFLSVVRRLREANPRRTVAGCLALFSVTTVVTHAVFARFSEGIIPEHGLSIFSRTAALLLMFSVPYFFAGLGVALSLLAKPEAIGKSYFVNLVGSAAGCFAVYPFLASVGAEGIVLGVALFTALVAALALAGPARLAAGGWSLAVVGAWFAQDAVLPFQPDSTDQYRAVQSAFTRQAGEPIEAERVYERWDPVGKIELYHFPPPYNLFGGVGDSILFTQDAGAGSVLVDVREHPEMATALAQGTLYGLASSLRPGGEALVIGLGGAPDLLACLENGMSRVVGAEINAGTLDVLDRAYRDFVDLDRERLELVLADGRSYVRQFAGEFDLVQMTGADTYAASASSGSMLAENYLYTIEAFRDYLNAVKDDGLVSITRFAHESGKVVTTMVDALRELGASDPAKHIVVTIQGPTNYRWRNVLVKKTPFTEEELARIEEQAARSVELGPKTIIPVYQPIGFGFNSEMVVAVQPSTDGSPDALDAITSSPDYDFTPATDDKPFFFNFKDFELSFARLFGSGEKVAKHQFDVTDYLVIVVQISLIALLLILGPLIAFKLGGERLAASVPLALYFFGIGVGFMFLEICLMQKCGLFLGHPNYSISTVLFSLLVFSGVGSYVSGRWSARPLTRVTFAMAGIAIWVLFFGNFAQGIFEEYLTLDIGARIAILVAIVAPLGFCAGMPFPTCLREVDRRVPRFSPWAIGTNGFASVVASLATIPISMQIGFSNTLYLGLAAYFVAWLAFAAFQRIGR